MAPPSPAFFDPAPDVELYSVKVFAERLRTDSRVLAAAIRSCIANDIRIINLSLGTCEISEVDSLRVACEMAAQRDIILVAAGAEGERIFPASFPGVVSVSADERCGWSEYVYKEGSEVEFLAHPAATAARRGAKRKPPRSQHGDRTRLCSGGENCGGLSAGRPGCDPTLPILECSRAAGWACDAAQPHSGADESFPGDNA